jgi:hypothetical protein
MTIPSTLAIGQQLPIADPVVAWDAQISDSHPPGVRLVASIQAGPTPPIFPSPAGATTVELHMDGAVATELWKKLGDLIFSMGWLIGELDEDQG